MSYAIAPHPHTSQPAPSSRADTAKRPGALSTKPERRNTAPPSISDRLIVQTAATTHDNAATVAATGEIDLFTTLTFRDAAFSAIGQRPTRLTLDLTQITFMDTTGLSALLTVLRVARLVHVPVSVAPSASVRRLLELSSLADVLVSR